MTQNFAILVSRIRDLLLLAGLHHTTGAVNAKVSFACILLGRGFHEQIRERTSLNNSRNTHKDSSEPILLRDV